MPVMISPFFSRGVDAEAYARWWDEIALPRISVDILALQDGVGTHRTTIDDLKPVYAALAPVMKRHGVQFWSNNEAFDQTAGWPVNNDPWEAQAALFPRFQRQLNATTPFTSKTVLFEYTQYMDPDASPQAASLFEAYEEYLTKGRQ